MIKTCLIVDTETTGIDAKEHKVIEIAAILYSVEVNAILGTAAMLIPADSNEAEAINHISVPMMAAADDKRVLHGFGSMLNAMVDASDVFIAHQASFEKDHLGNENLQVWTSKPWLCTKEDFRFAKGKPGDSLVNTALAHGIPVFGNHRARPDVDLIASIFGTYSPEVLQDLFSHAMLPRDYYVALTGYNEKDKPKAAGFAWNGDKKCWWKKLTLGEAASLDFPTRKVAPESVGGR